VKSIPTSISPKSGLYKLANISRGFLYIGVINA